MSLSALYGFCELRVVLGTHILHAAAVCSVLLSVSPLVLNAHCPNSIQSPS